MKRLLINNMSTRRNKKHINEMSPEKLWRAASAQRRRLKDNDYLKSITAFDYIKQLKRVSDFEDYADEIVNKINAGQINDDIPQEEIQKEIEVQKEKHEQTDAPKPSQQTVVTPQVSGNNVRTTTNGPLVPQTSKERYAVMKAAPAELKFKKHPKPIVNRTPDFEKFFEGDYVVVYISNIDDSMAAVIINASSKNAAAKEVLNNFWDVQEIVAVSLEKNYDANAFSDNTADTSSLDNNAGTPATDTDINIDPSDYSSVKDLANSCASIVSGGEFNNYNELVADIKDDETTEQCADDDYYRGEDNEGMEWGGKKASVRLICEASNYDWSSQKPAKNDDEYDVEIITQINDGQEDSRITARLTAKMMKKALSQGIVHIVFIKADGQERQAFATTSQEVLEENNAVPMGTSDRNYTKENHIRFYDMTIKAWRSFLMERLTIVYDESY